MRRLTPAFGWLVLLALWWALMTYAPPHRPHLTAGPGAADLDSAVAALAGWLVAALLGWLTAIWLTATLSAAPSAVGSASTRVYTAITPMAAQAGLRVLLGVTAVGVATIGPALAAGAPVAPGLPDVGRPPIQQVTQYAAPRSGAGGESAVVPPTAQPSANPGLTSSATPSSSPTPASSPASPGQPAASPAPPSGSVSTSGTELQDSSSGAPTAVPSDESAGTAHPDQALGTPTLVDSRDDELVVVLRGDSLWAIAARHLPSGAPNSDIAAAWPAWFQANLEVIGSDPDQLLPGTLLRAPD